MHPQRAENLAAVYTLSSLTICAQVLGSAERDLLENYTAPGLTSKSLVHLA